MDINQIADKIRNLTEKIENDLQKDQQDKETTDSNNVDEYIKNPSISTLMMEGVLGIGLSWALLGLFELIKK